jgi:hypothetical protein
MKLPAFQFYPGDWRKDVGLQSLDYQARGVWIEMLCLMHESERRGVLTLNGQAMPDPALARLLGIEEVLLKQILTTLLNHGVTTREDATGALMSRRMVRDEKLREIRANCGKQGGNPLLLKQKPTTRVNQKPTPSSSVSSSSSSADDTEEDALRPAPPVEAIKKPRRELPTLEAWTAAAKELHPDWPTDDALNAWEHYEKVGWKTGKNRIEKWRFCIGTCYRNWLRREGGGSGTTRKMAFA